MALNSWHSVLVGLITPFIMRESPGYVPCHLSYYLVQTLHEVGPSLCLHVRVHVHTFGPLL